MPRTRDNTPGNSHNRGVTQPTSRHQSELLNPSTLEMGKGITRAELKPTHYDLGADRNLHV